jgi:hypothetical protein
VNEVTEAYIQLRRKGIDPTAELMTSLGDLASSNGATLGQVAEGIVSLVNRNRDAVLQGATGINFAIKGNKLFADGLDGTQKKIDKTFPAVAAYLQEQGKLQGIGGGMARQMETLGGRFSNLKDQLWALAVTIGKAGLADLIRDATTSLIKFSEKIGEFAKDEGRVKRVLNAIKVGVLAIGTAFSSLMLGKAISWIAKMRIAWNAAGAAALRAQLKMLAIPLAIAAIVLAVQDLISFTQGKDSLFGRMLESQGIDPEPFREKFRVVGESFQILWTAIKEGAYQIAESLGINKLSWEEVVTAIVQSLANATLAVARFVVTAIDQLLILGNWIGTHGGWLFLKLSETWDTWKATFEGDQGGVKGTWKTTVEWMDDIWSATLDRIKSAWHVTGEWIDDKWSALFDRLRVPMGDFFEFLGGGFGGLSGYFESIFDDIFAGFLMAIDAAINGIASLLDSLPDAVLDVLPAGVAEFAKEGSSLYDDYVADKERKKRGARLDERRADSLGTPSQQALAFATQTRLTEEDRARLGYAARPDYESDILSMVAPPTIGALSGSGYEAASPLSAALVSMGRGGSPSLSLSVGGVSVSVEGSVDMTSDEFLGRVRDGAKGVFESIIEETFADLAVI